MIRAFLFDKDGTLIDWTSKITYVLDTTDPYATYKVVGTYKSYTGIQTEPATFELEEEIEEEEDEEETPTDKPTNSTPPTNTNKPTTNTQ